LREAVPYCWKLSLKLFDGIAAKKHTQGKDRAGERTWHVILACLAAAAGLLAISAVTTLLLAGSRRPKTDTAAVPVH
jgi:hypothetical protein